MAKITRKLQKIFGADSGAQGVTTYGSPASGTPVYSKDLDAIQTAAWDGGWASAALSGTEIPTFQDFNAIHYATTSQLAYLNQMGVYEWHTEQDYYTGSITNLAGVLYSAVQDNTGENPSSDDGSNWLPIGGSGGGMPAGMVFNFAGDTVPDDALLRDGSLVSRSVYANLFAAIGTTYGAGDGTTTFQLPDDVTGNKFTRASGGSLSVGDTQSDSVGNFTGRLQGRYQGWDSGGTPVLNSTVNVFGIQNTAGVNATTSNYNFTTTGAETRPTNRAYLPCIKF